MICEDYVSFEQAKALKEMGFDWECQAYFEDYLDELNRHHRKFRFSAVANNMLHKDFCSAPSLGQAQKWLREVKELDIDITLFREIDAREEPAKIKRYYNCEIAFSEYEEDLDENFASYEQALSAGIDVAIQMQTMNAIQSINRKMKDSTTIDWEQRRYEIAKEIFTRCLSSSDGDMRGFSANHLEMHAEDCVREADALIDVLKRNAK